MSDPLNERLNKILPRLISDELLSGSGIGKEMAFYIFDYLPEDELRVRDFLHTLLDHIPKQRHGLRVKHINLFDLLLDYLRSRSNNLLDKALRLQRQKGDAFMKNELLKGPLIPKRFAGYFGTVARPQEHDLVIVSGVGSAFPLVRTHALLSNLHPIMGNTPLVMFYPGKYDQITFRLFGKVTLSTSVESETRAKNSENYYRAFKLVP